MQICKICLKRVTGEQRELDYHNLCLNNLFDSKAVSPILNFSREVFKTELSQKYVKGMSISGIQKKLSLRIDAGVLTLTNSGGTYILKPTVEDFPSLSENEHLSMLIGKALDVETPPLGLIKFSDGELVYIIKRFDWKGSDKIHKEDMTQVFALNRDTEEKYKYGESYEQVGLKLKEVTGGKLTVVLDFFNRLIYNFLIQNGDYHLKNISVVSERLTREGHYQGMAPNYDSVNTRIYLPTETDLALDLLKDETALKQYQNNGFYTRADFGELGINLGLTVQAMDVVFEKVLKRKKDIMTLIEMSFLSSPMKAKYQEHVSERLKNLGIV